MSPRAGAATSGYFLRAVFDAERLRAVFFAGTLAPSRRASDRPMAMACLRLVTFCPELERSVPRFFSPITSSTFADAFRLYFRPDDFFAFFAILDLRAVALPRAPRDYRGCKVEAESPSPVAICYTPVA
jgi:hypothetical protein